MHTSCCQCPTTLTCTVTQTGNTAWNVVLGWTQYTANSIIHTNIHPAGGPITFGDITINANLLNTTNSTVIVSNMTLKSVAFANNNDRIYCSSPSHDTSQTETIIAEGTQSKYFAYMYFALVLHLQNKVQLSLSIWLLSQAQKALYLNFDSLH